MLGWISEKYESGGFGPGTISNTPHDPGGKSYGSYQLSLNAGTLANYVYHSIFGGELSAELGSTFFDDEWRDLASKYPFEFKYDQYTFILRYKFLSASCYAKILGFFTDHPAIQEAVFSIAVQHGGWKKVLADGQRGLTVHEQCVRLYASRKAYVRSLNLSPQLTDSLVARYQRELLDVIALIDVR